MAGYRSIGTNPYNELNFLTNIVIDNSNNTDTIYNTLENDGRLEKEGVAFKGKTVIGTEKLKRHFNTSSDNTTVVNGKRVDVNPYTKLISDFSKDSSYNSLKLSPADFVYLTGIKNMPLNRLWILRRFADGVIVPDNLTDWQTKTPPEPIAVVVGWVSPTEDSFHSHSFNEEWETITKRWDQVIFEMMDNEFGINMNKVIPIPGFSQGLLFGFLEKMGVTTFTTDNIPMGNPNILAEGATRIADASTQKQGLKSNFVFNLNTEYEQKFLGDVDPGSAMMDILYNLTRMGTSNIEYMFRRDSEIIQSLLQAANAKNSKELWMNFITTVVEKFIEAVSEVFQELTGIDFNEKSSKDSKNTAEQSSGFFDYGGKTYKKVEKYNTDGDMESGYPKYASKSNTGNVSYNGIDEKQYNSAYNAYKKDPKQAQKNEANKAKSNISGALDLANGAIKTILASTVAKYKWPLIGGVGVGTGINTTPWHITIGNPYSPFVSMGNIIVDKVEIKTNNELSFNDMPTRFSVNIQAKQGRNLGGQEMLSSFNNGYKRVYENTKAPEDLKVKSNNTQPQSQSLQQTPSSVEPEPTTVNIAYTYSPKVDGDTIIIRVGNNANLDTFEVSFGKNYSYNDNGMPLKGIEGCTKSVSFTLDNFGDFRDGVNYPITGTKTKVE